MMWKLWLAVAAAAFLVAALVAVVPLFPVPSGNRTVGEGNYAYFQVRSLLIDEELVVSWHSSTDTSVWTEDCGSTEPSSTGSIPCSSPSDVTVSSNGTSGSVHLTAAGGDWIAVGTVGANASISLTTTDSEASLGSAVLGAALIYLAVRSLIVARPSKEKASPPAPPDTKKGEGAENEEHEAQPAAPGAPVAGGPAGEGNDEGTR